MAAFAHTQARHVFHDDNAGFFKSLFARLKAWNEARQTRDALASLTDRELDDIGVSRAEIEAIASRRTHA